jgi:thymidylate synthase ThyX
MKIIKPSVEIISERDNAKRIEIAGRTCYKSEDKIAPGTAQTFCQMLIKRGHTAMLEHSNIIVLFRHNDERAARMHIAIRAYMEATGLPSMLRHTRTYTPQDGNRDIYSGNVRAWRDVLPHARLSLNFGDDDLFAGVEVKKTTIGDLTSARIDESELTESERARHGIITARFVCAEGVSLEAFRHRIAAADYERDAEPPAVCLSPAQESTRYCDYGGGDIQFVEPWWWTDEDSRAVWGPAFEVSCLEAEKHYKHLRAANVEAPPLAARAVLTKAVKTEIVITQTPERWRDWLALRDAKNAHPDMQICAKLFHKAAVAAGLL